MFSILFTPPAPLVKGGVEGETFIPGGVEGETFIPGGVERETFILGESQFPLLVPPLYQFHKCLLQMML
jgi:hypothetical protein